MEHVTATGRPLDASPLLAVAAWIDHHIDSTEDSMEHVPATRRTVEDVQLEDTMSVAEALLYALEYTEQTAPMAEHAETPFHAGQALRAYDDHNPVVQRFACLLNLEALLAVPTATLGTMLHNTAKQLHTELSMDVWSARHKDG